MSRADRVAAAIAAATAAWAANRAPELEQSASLPEGERDAYYLGMFTGMYYALMRAYDLGDEPCQELYDAINLV